MWTAPFRASGVGGARIQRESAELVIQLTVDKACNGRFGEGGNVHLEKCSEALDQRPSTAHDVVALYSNFIAR